jgi:NADH:ubiquinone oxidoreductase subunit 4 (subunit M)
VLLTLYILIPAVAALVAWLLGRVDTRLSRWTAVAGTVVPLVLLVVQWVANAG